MSHIKMRKRSNSAIKDPSKKLYDEKAEEVKKFKHGDVEQNYEKLKDILSENKDFEKEAYNAKDFKVLTKILQTFQKVYHKKTQTFQVRSGMLIRKQKQNQNLIQRNEGIKKEKEKAQQLNQKLNLFMKIDLDQLQKIRKENVKNEQNEGQNLINVEHPLVSKYEGEDMINVNKPLVSKYEGNGMIDIQGTLQQKAQSEGSTSHNEINPEKIEKQKEKSLLNIKMKTLISKAEGEEAINPTLNHFECKEKEESIYSSPAGMYYTKGNLISKMPVEGQTITPLYQQIMQTNEEYNAFAWLDDDDDQLEEQKYEKTLNEIREYNRRTEELLKKIKNK